MAAIRQFMMKVGLDDNTSKQFGSKFDPHITEDTVDDFLLLVRNTLIEIMSLTEDEDLHILEDNEFDNTEL